MSRRLDTEEKQKHWRCVIRRQLGKAMPDKPLAGYRAETEHWRCLSGGVQWGEASPGEPPVRTEGKKNYRFISRRQEQ